MAFRQHHVTTIPNEKLLNEPHQLTDTANDGSLYVRDFTDACDSLQH